VPKKLIGSLVPLFTILLLARGLFISDAYAYLDPGTGSIMFQALIGALVGLVITLKVFWYKIKIRFSS